MPKTPLVTIKGGAATFIDSRVPAGLKVQGRCVTRRASHVEPDGFLARLAFHGLRRAFGEAGEVANWTRSWGTLWRVNMSPVGGPVLAGRWVVRQQALDAEVFWLGHHLAKGDSK